MIEESASSLCLTFAALSVQNQLASSRGEEGEKETLNSQLENIPNVDKIQIIAFLVLNYIYLLHVQQMKILHTQTYIGNHLQNRSKDCLKIKLPPHLQLP